MLRDRKIKKIIKKATKPQKSFEEFCAENNIPLESPKQTAKPRKFFTILAPVALTTILVFGISMPFLTKTIPETPNVEPELKIYGDSDVQSTRMTYEELVADQNLTLLNFENVEQYSSITKVLPLENSDLILGYKLQEVLYGFWIGDALYAYEVDYIVRCNEHYVFSDIKSFENLEYETHAENVKFSFGIDEEQGIGYVSFNTLGYYYYLTVSDFENITEINKDSIETLLENAF